MSYNDNPSYLKLAGGTMSGDLILNTSSPATDLSSASKGYVDSVATGLLVQASCYAATVTDMVGFTYNNGVSGGVGATLTAAGAGIFSIDGVSPPVSSRVLIKDRATAAQNGIYVVTVSSGGSPAVLTRATDYDTAAEIQPGDFVIVQAGSVNAHMGFVQTATVVNVGIDDVTFVQFGSTNASTVTIENDPTTNANMNLVWVTTTSGNLPLKVSNNKLTFNPSTSTLEVSGVFSALGIINSDSWVQSDIHRQAANNSTLTLSNTGSSTSDASVNITSASGGITLNPNIAGGKFVRINNPAGMIGNISVISGTSSSTVPNLAYVASNVALTSISLPTTANVGDILEISAMSTGLFTVTQAASQYIRLGNAVSTTGVGGSISATAIGDSVTLRCIVASNGWQAVSMIGNITVV